MNELLETHVHAMAEKADGIVEIELRPNALEHLPGFDAGSHIDLHLPDGTRRSYSLLNAPGETHRYVIAVLKEKASRGGSRYLHEELHEGDTMQTSPPRNNFALHEDAGHSVLVAGGIGITPILSMGRRLKTLGRTFEIFYLARSKRAAAYLTELQELNVPLHLHFDDENGAPPVLEALLGTIGEQNPDTHFYACGPGPMLDAFLQACAKSGHSNAHIERFSGAVHAASDQARTDYEVELRRSGRTLQVSSGKSLLMTLLDANVQINFSCEEGYCGACETPVLEGSPDHRDALLTPEEQLANRSMMVCVSGCKTARLVLDL